MQTESVAKVLIVDANREALILRTGVYKARPERSHTPDLPGGLVEPGESEMQGAIREAAEEAGISLSPQNVVLGYAQTKKYDDEGKSVSKLLYVAHIQHQPEIKLSFEHEAYEWTPINEVLERHELRPFYQEAVQYIIEAGLV